MNQLSSVYILHICVIKKRFSTFSIANNITYLKIYKKKTFLLSSFPVKITSNTAIILKKYLYIDGIRTRNFPNVYKLAALLY